jgi:ankyrin repeat protein
MSMSFALANRSRFIPLMISEQSEPPTTSLSSERTTQPPLPAAGPLNSWRGKALVTDGEQIDVRLDERGPERCVIKFHLRDREPGDSHYLELYRAFPNQVWKHCAAAETLLPEKHGQIIFKMPDERSCDAVERAVREVKTLLGFMQLIGGGLSHICGWLNSPQMVCDLHEVLGPAGFQCMPAALGETLQSEAVGDLAKCFAESGRRDLLLAMLDLAVRGCRNPPSDLSRQWICLAIEAQEEGMDVPEITQIVARGLLRSRPRWLDANDRNALTRLANSPQLSSPTTASRREDDALSGLTPSPSPLIWHSPGPGAVAAARACLGQYFNLGLFENGASDSSDLSRASDGSTAGDACIVLPEKIYQLQDADTADKMLMDACKTGDLPTVQACIQMGADVNARGEYGYTPLIHAARGGYKNIVECLIAHDADVNSCDNQDDTPLLLASAAGHTGIVAHLLLYGANVEARNTVNMTPLMLAAQRGKESVVDALILGGANRKAKDPKGRTAVQFATQQRHYKLARKLSQRSRSIGKGVSRLFNKHTRSKKS